MNTPERLHHNLIFINLPVGNIEAAVDFYQALGWTYVEDFSDELSAAFQISDTIMLMLLRRDNFDSFHGKESASADSPREVINCLTVGTAAAVDEMLRRAQQAGGRIYQEANDESGVYGGAFEDPAGHAWEFMAWSE